mmetsp:Transcript_14622/g.42151  ORF Transcript_14622/g.42151 Transcript_14622/m.42151 type:complete len:105 (-) Transcript_14622:2089-2403(-)
MHHSLLPPSPTHGYRHCEALFCLRSSTLPPLPFALSPLCFPPEPPPPASGTTADSSATAAAATGGCKALTSDQAFVGDGDGGGFDTATASGPLGLRAAVVLVLW